jgi:hypothetical protein
MPLVRTPTATRAVRLAWPSGKIAAAWTGSAEPENSVHVLSRLEASRRRRAGAPAAREKRRAHCEQQSAVRGLLQRDEAAGLRSELHGQQESHQRRQEKDFGLRRIHECPLYRGVAATPAQRIGATAGGHIPRLRYPTGSVQSPLRAVKVTRYRSPRRSTR